MKKKIVQKKLTTSWAVYNKRPAFLSMPPDFKNKTMLIPIKTNSTDHTIGNTLPGGARGGFFNVSNLVIASLVKKDESRPTPRAMAIEIRYGFAFFSIGSPPRVSDVFLQAFIPRVSKLSLGRLSIK